MTNLRTFLLVLVVFLAVDWIWVGWLSQPYWSALVKKITGSPMKVNIWSAVGAYLLLAVGITWLVLPQVDSVQSALIKGALFGLVVYGVFDLTNMTIFSQYDKRLALADTLWGTFASAMISVIVFKLIENK